MADGKLKTRLLVASSTTVRSLQLHRIVSSILSIHIDLGTLLSNLTIFAVFIFYLANAGGGHDWGGDFSLYIMNARNIAHGLPYAATNYIYNIDTAYCSPPAYSPIFPLILAPLISAFGIDLQILKLPGILCLVGTLLFLNLKVLPVYLSSPSRIIFLLALGFYPFYFVLSESVLSDFTFLLFTMIALQRINNAFKPDDAAPAGTMWPGWLLTGVFIYLAYGTRSIGVVLLPVAFTFGLIKRRKITPALLVILVVPVLLIIIQSILIPQTGAYLDQVPNTIPKMLSTVYESIKYYLVQLAGIFAFRNFIIQGIVFVLLLEGFTIGMITHLKKEVSSFDLFLLFYCLLLLTWPSYQATRFLVPVIPIYFLYILIGFDQVVRIVKWPSLRKSLPLLLAAGLICYGAYVYPILFPRQVSAMEKASTQELFGYVRAETDPGDVIAFFKPSVLALYTDRKSVMVAVPAPGGNTLARMKELGVDFVILRKDYDLEYQVELGEFVDEHPQNFVLVYENPEFQMMKVDY